MSYGLVQMGFFSVLTGIFLSWEYLILLVDLDEMQLEKLGCKWIQGIVELFGVLLSSNKVYGNDP